ncbi:DMT family transporter [Clostridium sporogenes]|uniref:DMT family transporter n=1 Tax=unclassified Clostridium TaxID=2614128 RepID=UPI0013D44D32|nr:DMT family transporter [Clostridium sporogenes]NFS25770.1 DMT family transporter [Clostridium sporogenes]
MMGIIYSIISGLAMTLQGVFNTRLGDKIGMWETNTLVQGTGFIITIIIWMLAGDGNFKAIKNVNKLYLLGGFLGVIIIYTVMKGIGALGPTYAIGIILISQLTSAALVDAFGFFDSQTIKFGPNKIIGVIVMLIGIIIFKYKS